MSIFEGLRVLDCSTGIAGPYATMLFADHGADVVKVEPPEGDPYRAEPGFQTLNRGKRSAILDLGTDEGQATLLRLVRHADIVVTDLPRHRARERGLDEARLRAERPDLVYLAVPPYGDHGPLVDHPASPQLLAAVTGVTAFQASQSGHPVALLLPIVAYATGALAATTVAAALFARERWGIGQRLEVSELAGSLALQLGAVTSDQVPPLPEGPAQVGSRGATPAYCAYEAGDGRWLFVGCGTNDFFRRLLTATGHPELIDDPRLAGGPWATNMPEALALVYPLLQAAFVSRPRDDWLRILREADVPAAPVQTRDEFLDSDLVRANGLVASVDHPELGRIEMAGVPLTLEAAPGMVRGRAPLLGEHTAQVLANTEADPPPVREPRGEPGPYLLSGVRVVDLASFIAGPAAARHLGMLGAEVVKVEPPEGDPFRTLALGFLGWNQGKRSLVVNLGAQPGREVLSRLLDDADVLVENVRPAAAKRMGVDGASLRAAYPRLVHVSTTGFGDDPAWVDAPAFDGLLQALAGLAHQQGGGVEPVYHSIPVTDMMTPLLSAFGACAALYYRARMGEGQRVRTSLLASALAIQAAECTRFEGAAHAAGGLDFPGPSAGERWYRCAGGEAIYVEARTPAQRHALVAALGVELDPEALAGPAVSPAAEVLATAFAAGFRARWLGVLATAGVPAAAVVPRRDLLLLDAVVDNGLFVEHEHPDWAVTREPGLLVHASRTPGRIAGRAPRLSEHASEVLTELGYDLAQQRALVEAGAVSILDLPGPSREERATRSAALAAEAHEALYAFTLRSHDLG